MSKRNTKCIYLPCFGENKVCCSVCGCKRTTQGREYGFAMEQLDIFKSTTFRQHLKYKLNQVLCPVTALNIVDFSGIHVLVAFISLSNAGHKFQLNMICTCAQIQREMAICENLFLELCKDNAKPWECLFDMTHAGYASASSLDLMFEFLF